MALEKVLASCNTRLEYIKKNCSNAYILKECNIIDIKLTDIKNRKYKTQKVLNNAVDQIIRSDINKMKRTVGLEKKIVNKLNELEGFIKQIKDVYFED